MERLDLMKLSNPWQTSNLNLINSISFVEQNEPQEGGSYSTSDLKSGFRMRSQKQSFVTVDLHAHVP